MKYNHLEKKLTKKYEKRDKKKRKKMNVSGKNVFKLAKLLTKK